MKLVHVTHRRCMDYDCATFVLAPDEWSEDEIETRLLAAQGAYAVAVRVALDGIEKVPYPSFPNVTNMPDDMTLAQVRAEHAEQKARYDAAEAKRREATKGFERFLVDAGFVSIWADEANAVQVECDWGHNHGVRFDYYSVGNPDEKKMPTPAKLAAAIKHIDDTYDEDAFG